ncbi:hypothetical protein D7X96_30875 [Corallococcus interemptor]|uniref:Uncharacterized protein n=1 Tax=Corallococcus interemptor TaxID=2316720 RepID=A0A3A8PZM8_9BACT|nr:hypothetical protein [Corallococcus interemptor]RKH61803.1 hypothetical protein D7X96_30875 [Corallococcus interemptor]
MKTLLVAALFAASAAVASPPPTKAPTDTRGPTHSPATGTLETPTGEDIQADPNAPSKHESKTGAEPELKASGRADAVFQDSKTSQQKPLKRPAPAPQKNTK